MAKTQKRPRCPASLFRTSPLVVLSNFSGASHLKLGAVMVQNMFPSIDVQTVNLAACQRLVLLSYDAESNRVHFRQYSINAEPTGVSKGVKRLLQRKDLPDLGELGDVGDYLQRAGYDSESDAEGVLGGEDNSVDLPASFGSKTSGMRATAAGGAEGGGARSRVKLHEIGPRMELEMLKVEEGMCAGTVMYHLHETRTPEEAKTLAERAAAKTALKRQRREEQERNVDRKRKAKEEKAEAKRRKREERKRGKGAGGSDDEVEDVEYGDGRGGGDNDLEDDRRYYREQGALSRGAHVARARALGRVWARPSAC